MHQKHKINVLSRLRLLLSRGLPRLSLPFCLSLDLDLSLDLSLLAESLLELFLGLALLLLDLLAPELLRFTGLLLLLALRSSSGDLEGSLLREPSDFLSFALPLLRLRDELREDERDDELLLLRPILGCAMHETKPAK